MDVSICMHGIDSIGYILLFLPLFTIGFEDLCSMAFVVVCFLDTTMYPSTQKRLHSVSTYLFLRRDNQIRPLFLPQTGPSSSS